MWGTRKPPRQNETRGDIGNTDSRWAFFKRMRTDLDHPRQRAAEGLGGKKEDVKDPETGNVPQANGPKRLLNRLVLPLLKRWIAGENIQDAIETAMKLNLEGSSVMLNYLGEHYERREEVDRTMGEYAKMLEIVSARDVDFCISFKLSQLGMDIEQEYCYENAKRMAEMAREKGKLAWIDMEGSAYTDRTLEVYRRLLSEGYDNVCLCLQANLRRTKQDLEDLLELNKSGIFVRIRLCKGAYKEPADVAYQSRDEIDQSFYRLIKMLEGSDGRNLLAIATHDPKFLEMGSKVSKKRQNVEIQMLKGIEEDARAEITSRGVSMVTYLPYGEDSVAYCLRRLRKGRGTAALIVSSLYRV